MTIDVTLPVDTGRSRLDRGRPSTSAPAVNPDDLATVDAKVAAFWDLYPDGAIDASDVEQIGEDAWRATAYIWKDADSDGRADSTGSASRTRDIDGHASGEYPLESAQSVAIGRALRFMGILATRTPGEDNTDG